MLVRFPSQVSTHEEARQYYLDRGIQLRPSGWHLHTLTELDYGVEATIRSPEGVDHKSVFVLEQDQGKGHFTRWLQESEHPYASGAMCPEMLNWLHRYQIRYTPVPKNNRPAYLAAEKYCGDRKARRSGIFWMNHVDEGLLLLKHLGASDDTLDAWCLHPMLQPDDVLPKTLKSGALCELITGETSVALAMEYRAVANAHLSKHEPKIPELSPIHEVNLMLVADKVQNQKDYLLYVRNHPECYNAKRLDAYFPEWFDALGITLDMYRGYNELICPLITYKSKAE